MIEGLLYSLYYEKLQVLVLSEFVVYVLKKRFVFKVFVLTLFTDKTQRRENHAPPVVAAAAPKLYL